jgi:hypothetical protein
MLLAKLSKVLLQDANERSGVLAGAPIAHILKGFARRD